MSKKNQCLYNGISFNFTWKLFILYNLITKYSKLYNGIEMIHLFTYNTCSLMIINKYIYLNILKDLFTTIYIWPYIIMQTFRVWKTLWANTTMENVCPFDSMQVEKDSKITKFSTVFQFAVFFKLKNKFKMKKKNKKKTTVKKML